MSRSRGWCFTINNPKTLDKEKVLALQAEYLVCGEEEGEQHTPHLQGYLYFGTVKSRSQISKMLPRAHLVAAKGTGQQNRDYCTKEGKILCERGSMPKDPKAQGAKGKEFWEEIKNQATAGSLDDIDPKTYVTLYGALRAIQKDHAQKMPACETTTGEWWYGPSGTGKSKTARETYPDAYIKGVNKWWDGYRGEEVVIIEDLDKFNVSMGGDLKRWCDHYSFPAEIKGGGMNIRPKKIIITSQYDIGEIWEDEATVDALNRRCKKRRFGEEPEPVAEASSSSSSSSSGEVWRDYASFK